MDIMQEKQQNYKKKPSISLWLAGLLLGISLGLCPQQIPWSSPASPWKTPSIKLLNLD
jgi:hypothetical protein